jgi:NAD(P)-dependent dehydrogenase (short-subunit alcohol dehydrogenase family)
MDLELTDRVIVVTGGSSGVGLALVNDLLSCGARVATCARDLDRLDAATSALDGHDPDRLLTMACDVRLAGQVDRFIAATHERFGAVDGLVNNAGQSLMRGFADTAFDEWMSEFELKFAGVIHPVTAARNYLAASDAGVVVNVNAVLARQPEPRLAATSAARAGLLNLTRTLASDLGPEGIRVNSVLLGLIDTGQWRRRFDQRGDDQRGDDVEQSWEEWSAAIAADRGITLGRLGTAREVSYVITMLLSPRASYVTGTSIDVAGGVGRYV